MSVYLLFNLFEKFFSLNFIEMDSLRVRLKMLPPRKVGLFYSLFFAFLLLANSFCLL